MSPGRGLECQGSSSTGWLWVRLWGPEEKQKANRNTRDRGPPHRITPLHSFGVGESIVCKTMWLGFHKLCHAEHTRLWILNLGGRSFGTASWQEAHSSRKGCFSTPPVGRFRGVQPPYGHKSLGSGGEQRQVQLELPLDLQCAPIPERCLPTPHCILHMGLGAQPARRETASKNCQ